MAHRGAGGPVHFDCGEALPKTLHSKHAGVGVRDNLRDSPSGCTRTCGVQVNLRLFQLMGNSWVARGSPGDTRGYWCEGNDVLKLLTHIRYIFVPDACTLFQEYIG